jgi:hypothetical protein
MDDYHEKNYEKLYFSSKCKRDQFGEVVQEQVSVEELCKRISKREWWEPK